MKKGKTPKDLEAPGIIVLTVGAFAALLVQIFWNTEHPAKTVLCWALLGVGALFFFLFPLFAYRKQYGSRADRLRLLFSDELKTVAVTCSKSEKRLGALAPDRKVFSVSLYADIDTKTLLRSHTLDAEKTVRKKANEAFRGEVKIDLNGLLSLSGKTVVLEQDLDAVLRETERFQPLFKNNTVVCYNVLGEDQS